MHWYRVRRHHLPLASTLQAHNIANDIFAGFRRALEDQPDEFVVVLTGLVQGDLPEYVRLCGLAFDLGYEVQRHALEPFGGEGTAIMFIRPRWARTPNTRSVPNGL